MKIGPLKISAPRIALPTSYRRSDWLLCLLPAIGIGAVQVLYWLTYDFTMECDGFLAHRTSCWKPVLSQSAPVLKPFDPPKWNPADSVAVNAINSAVSGEFNARLAWMAAVVILTAVCFTSVGLGIRWIRTCLNHSRGIGMLFTLLIVVGVGWGAYSGVRARHFVVIHDLFANSPTLPFLDTIYSSVFIMRLFTFLAATFLIGAACVTPAPPDRSVIGEVAKARHFAGSIQQLQYILFACAALLLTAVIEFRALLNWSASAVESPFAPLMRDTGYAAAAATGTIYAVALAALYFPAAMILEMQGRKLAVAALEAQHQDNFTRADVSAWMQNNGLTFSVPRSVSSLLAVLSPRLVQIPISALLSAVK